MKLLTLLKCGCARVAYGTGFCGIRFRRVVPLVMFGMVFAACRTVSAGDLTAGPLPEVCMKTLTGTNLNCTASDIKIAKALTASCENIGGSTPNGCAGPTQCVAGRAFNLNVTFQVDVTANQRYDAGFYFDVSGDAEDDGAYTGNCFLSVLDKNVSPAQDLDGGDFCGDLNSGSYTNVHQVIPNVMCVDSDGDGKLNLPNCTAWHSNARTACFTATDATPETRSKCACDKNFQVEAIAVTPPSGGVTKEVSKVAVTYKVTVSNTGSEPVALTSLEDDIYGDLSDPNNPLIHDSTCATGGLIAAEDFYICEFQADITQSACVADTVTATLETEFGSVAPTGSAQVQVDFLADCAQ